jgi:hypothetical protein
MSLQHLAQNMAAQGRNGDSMLMHVTPDEVQRLQSMAMAEGGSLTINPETGLPEANFFSDLNPVHILKGEGFIGESGLGSLVIGAALASMGIPPMYAGLGTGAATAALTGSLQKGLFAGMGAYGGAGLMGGLAGLGGAESALANQSAAETARLTAAENIAAEQTKTGIANNLASAVENQSAAETARLGLQETVANAAQPVSPINAADAVNNMVPTTTQTPSIFDTAKQNFSNAGAGIDRLTSKGGFDALSTQMAGMDGPSLKTAALMGGAGLLAGSVGNKNTVPTSAQNPGYIRQYDYDPYSQRYTAMTPIEANKWGSRSFEDAYKAADGGVVALAGGGSLADQRLADYAAYAAAQQPQAPAPAAPAVKAPADPAALKLIQGMTGPTDNYSDQKIFSTLQTQGVTPEQASRVSGDPIQQMQQRYNEAPYNTMTGGSKDAYEYLMGRRDYNVKPYTPTGEIMRPYAEAVMGVAPDPTRFATKFDPTTRTYVNNPNYKSFIFDPGTGANTRGLTEAEAKAAAAAEALKPKTQLPAEYDNGYAYGGLTALACGGLGTLGGYSDGGRLLKGPGDGVSDSIPASIGDKQPARLADGEFVVPARIVSELGNGSTDAGARKLYQMMDRVQNARGKTTGKGKVATNSRAEKYLPV